MSFENIFEYAKNISTEKKAFSFSQKLGLIGEKKNVLVAEN